MKVSDLIQVSLLMEDDSGLVVESEMLRQRPKSKPPLFSLERYDDLRCKTDFRFEKEDILRLVKAMRLPGVMRARRLIFKSTEGICILLRRLAYPCRLADLVLIFGRCCKDHSRIFNCMIDYIYEHFGFLLTSLNQWWLEPRELKVYASAIKAKGSPISGCFGFIDGTIHKTCRPTYNQAVVYSGHKRVHGLKYQSTVLPNGVIANLHGPEPGRRHDSYMLNASKLLQNLDDKIHGLDLCLYGDSGYPLKKYLITPFLGSRLSPEQEAFNSTMSKLRICVEWEFGELYEQFAFLRFKYNQKIYLQPLAKYFHVAAILKNCQTCLHGSQTSFYYKLTPPTLESYLHNNKY